MGGAGHWTDRCYNLPGDKELLQFEPPEEKPSVMQNPLPSHGNDNAGPSSNAVNGQKVMFDSSQLITPRPSESEGPTVFIGATGWRGTYRTAPLAGAY